MQVLASFVSSFLETLYILFVSGFGIQSVKLVNMKENHLMQFAHNQTRIKPKSACQRKFKIVFCLTNYINMCLCLLNLINNEMMF